MIRGRAGLAAIGSQRGCAVALDAFRIGPIQRQAGEELCCHAAAPAAVVVVAASAGASGLRLPQFTKQRSVLPDVVETAVGQHVSSQETVVDGKWTGVDITDGVDEAHHAPGATHVQPGQRAGRAKSGQVEEGVTGEHPFPLATSQS